MLSTLNDFAKRLAPHSGWASVALMVTEMLLKHAGVLR